MMNPNRFETDYLPPPFSILKENLKSIRLSQFGTMEKQGIEFAFGKFFEDEQKNEKASAILDNLLGPSTGKNRGEQKPYRYRRFSGGSHLPGRRYFTIAEHNGYDYFSLEHELRSYVNHAHSGRIYIEDEISRNLEGDTKDDQGSKSKHYISIAFADELGWPNPFITRLIEAGKIPQRSESTKPNLVKLSLPYHLEYQEILKVIDLRLFETQQWLYHNLTKGIPGVVYQYSEHVFAPGLTIGKECPKENNIKNIKHISSGNNKIIWYPPDEDWKGETFSDMPNNFFGVIPYLVNPTQGGSPITEAIGRWLQILGANGLVYPASRTDVICKYDYQDRLIENSGWNFVDYRGTPESDNSTWIIMAPQSYCALPVGTSISIRSDNNSWELIGSFQAHNHHFLVSQHKAHEESKKNSLR